MPDITYTELVRRVPVWLYATNRSIVAEMPNIIAEAEEQLMQVMDHDLFRTQLPVQTIDPAGPLLDLAGLDILELRSIKIQPRAGRGFIPLARRDVDAMEMLFPYDRPGIPRFYAENRSIMEFQFFPPPQQEYSLIVAANVRPAKLSGSVDTNVLTEQFPRAIEKATMRQGALFMKNSQDAAQYEAEMNKAVIEANAQVTRRRRDNTGEKPREHSNVGV